VPNGGDHKTRKCIAKKLMHSARHGNTALGDFMTVARAALNEILLENRHSSSQLSALRRVAGPAFFSRSRAV
jgi:hypothetical protein